MKLKLWPTIFGLVAGGALFVADGMTLAIPPYPNLSRNSMDIQSATRRYRPQRPVTSPYLALSQGNIGTNTAVNLYQLVQPQVAQNQINQNQGTAVQQLQKQVRDEKQVIDKQEEELSGRSTENRSGFMTHQTYFGTNQQQNTGNRSPGPPAAPRKNPR